jgi:hypothetical protein
MTATYSTQGRDRSALWCVNLVIAWASLLMLVPGVISAAPPAQEGQSYTVQKDDTLWSIAEKYLGKGSAYTTIVAATNRKHEKDASFARIDNPNLIKLGWKLFIPRAEEATKLVAPGPCAPGSQPCVATWPGKPIELGAMPAISPALTPVVVAPTSTPTPGQLAALSEAALAPTPETIVSTAVPTNVTIPVNYFYVITALFIVLFALIGFALWHGRSLGVLMGIFFAYVAADKSAVFIRDGLNFVLKLELGDEIIPYLQGIIFFLAVIGVIGCFLRFGYTHTFATRLIGMLIGVLTGYLVSVFTLEFLREILVGWLGDQTAIFDFSYNVLGQEGLFIITLNFSSDPEAAYTVLRKALVPAILFTLWVVFLRAFGGFGKILSTILGAFVKWLSIKTPKKEEAKAT